MRACWGYFISRNDTDLDTPEWQQRFKVLCVSARQYRLMFPEDELVLYCSSQICSTLFRLCEAHEDAYWDQIIPLNLEFRRHDSSRFWVLTQQTEPFIYIDADFWVVTESKQELIDFKNAILSKPGFYLGHYRLNSQWNRLSIDSDFNPYVQKYIAEAKGSSKVWIQNCYEPDLDKEYINHSIVCGGTPMESYIIGAETLKFHQFLSDLEETDGYRLSLHEYASSKFAHLVGRVYGFNVCSDYVVNNLHLGGGGYSCTSWIEDTYTFEEGQEIWIKATEKLRHVDHSLSIKEVVATLNQIKGKEQLI